MMSLKFFEGDSAVQIERASLSAEIETDTTPEEELIYEGVDFDIAPRDSNMMMRDVFEAQVRKELVLEDEEAQRAIITNPADACFRIQATDMSLCASSMVQSLISNPLDEALEESVKVEHKDSRKSSRF